ncbi:Hypothetical protein FKW44_006733, partial [Caligus rogercresseyi]
QGQGQHGCKVGKKHIPRVLTSTIAKGIVLDLGYAGFSGPHPYGFEAVTPTGLQLPSSSE